MRAPRNLTRLIEAFGDAYRRWPSGIYLMWYPIRSGTQRTTGARAVRGAPNSEDAVRGLAIHPDDAGVGLAGSGLIIVNPPYGADAHLRSAYAAIHAALAAPGAGYVEVARLTPERMAQ